LASAINPTASDSLHLLGRYSLPAQRFFLPFASILAIENDMLLLKSNQRQSLLRWLLPAGFSLQNILIAFPEASVAPDWQFLEVLRGPVNCSGKDVFIFLDYPGITSYVANENTRNLVSTSELQIYAARQIRAGNYAVQWPDWKLVGIFFVALLPLIRYKPASSRATWPALCLGLLIIFLAGFYLGGVYIPKAWYGILATPTGLLCYDFISHRFARKIEQVQAAASRVYSVEQVIPSTRSDKVKQLREKLGFYEHLMNQTPPVALKNKGHPYILYHPDSPLARILQKAEQIAPADIPVMIFGESGTGKEQLAKYIHENSRRAEKPFIAVIAPL
jgi:hypothetical protein